MRFPSKVTPYNYSVLKDMVNIVRVLSSKELAVQDITRALGKKNWSVYRCMSVLELLFALGKVDIVEGKLRYVG